MGPSLRYQPKLCPVVVFVGLVPICKRLTLFVLLPNCTQVKLVNYSWPLAILVEFVGLATV